MKYPSLILLLALLSLQSCNNSTAQEGNNNAVAVSGNGFAVVELFTSEGCSSCPPADELANNIRANAVKNNQNIFVLCEHVDYWNHLGWKDPFSKRLFSDRQKWYSGFLKDEGIYTPQMVVNGTVSFVGSEEGKATKAINGALSAAKGTETLNVSATDFNKGSFAYTLSQIKSDEVLNVALIENDITSNVQKGENKGRTLHHDNVVRDWVTIEKPSASGTIQFDMDDIQINREKFAVVAFVQNKENGIISTVAVLK